MQLILVFGLLLIHSINSELVQWPMFQVKPGEPVPDTLKSHFPALSFSDRPTLSLGFHNAVHYPSQATKFGVEDNIPSTIVQCETFLNNARKE